MPGTYTPGQMFDHTEIELSGRSLSYPLDFAAPSDPTETVPVMQGGACSLNDDGQIVTGLGATGVVTAVDGKTPMCLIAIQGKEEYDVQSDIGNFSGGTQSALVASGGYEIETTEFVPAGAGDEYLPNEPLTFATGADRGKFEKAPDKYSTAQVVGVVSRKVNVNEYGKSVLAFWSVFCPAVNAS